MSSNRPIKLISLIALYALSVVGFVAWFQRPGDVLTVTGTHGVVARDAELAWTLNLPVAVDAKTPLPTITPAINGAWSWRDERTVVFTPSAPLPADAAYTVAFPERLRAIGNFGFTAQQGPLFTVHTVPAIVVTAVQATNPAFGDATIDFALSRMPSDSTALSNAVTVTPAVPFTVTVADGHVRVQGAFAANAATHISLATPTTGRVDDRPIAWMGDVAVPQRSAGARMQPGVHHAPRIEARGLDRVSVEATGEDGIVRHADLRFSGVGLLRTAEVPAWLVGSGNGRQQLTLRWNGGQAEATYERCATSLAPEAIAPALYGAELPLVVAR